MQSVFPVQMRDHIYTDGNVVTADCCKHISFSQTCTHGFILYFTFHTFYHNKRLATKRLLNLKNSALFWNLAWHSTVEQPPLPGKPSPSPILQPSSLSIYTHSIHLPLSVYTHMPYLPLWDFPNWVWALPARRPPLVTAEGGCLRTAHIRTVGGTTDSVTQSHALIRTPEAHEGVLGERTGACWSIWSLLLKEGAEPGIWRQELNQGSEDRTLVSRKINVSKKKNKPKKNKQLHSGPLKYFSECECKSKLEISIIIDWLVWAKLIIWTQYLLYVVFQMCCS